MMKRLLQNHLELRNSFNRLPHKIKHDYCKSFTDREQQQISSDEDNYCFKHLSVLFFLLHVFPVLWGLNNHSTKTLRLTEQRIGA